MLFVFLGMIQLYVRPDSPCNGQLWMSLIIWCSLSPLFNHSLLSVTNKVGPSLCFSDTLMYVLLFDVYFESFIRCSYPSHLEYSHIILLLYSLKKSVFNLPKMETYHSCLAKIYFPCLLGEQNICDPLFVHVCSLFARKTVTQ